MYTFSYLITINLWSKLIYFSVLSDCYFTTRFLWQTKICLKFLFHGWNPHFWSPLLFQGQAFGYKIIEWEKKKLYKFSSTIWEIIFFLRNNLKYRLCWVGFYLYIQKWYNLLKSQAIHLLWAATDRLLDLNPGSITY